METLCALKDNKCGIFNLVVNNLPVGLIIFDDSGRIIEVNPAAEKLTGYSRDELFGRCCSEIGDGLFDMIVPVESGALKKNDGDAAEAREAILVNRNGNRIPVLYFDAELRDTDHRMCGMVKMFRDISAEKRMRKKHEILISMFAHDLKTPVAIAGGFISRLLAGKGGELSEKQHEYLEVVDDELKKLDNHIHSFLDILRMEAGEIKLSLEKCSLEKIIYDIVDEFKNEAAARDIALKVSGPEQNLIVMVDREQIQRVLVNLIDNAIKYSTPHTIIEIILEEYDKYIVCKVKNEGHGIPAEDIPYIFDPFYQVTSTRKQSDSKGTGIGLAVVKSIVEAHNGKVWVDSSEDKGTVFGFSIPLTNTRKGAKSFFQNK